jgi:hypothetical protein
MHLLLVVVPSAVVVVARVVTLGRETAKQVALEVKGEVPQIPAAYQLGVAGLVAG